MRLLLFCTKLFCFFHICLLFEVIDPPYLKAKYYTTLYNEKYGRQDWENLNITAQMIPVPARDACQSKYTQGYKDRIVIHYGKMKNNLIEDYLEASLCIEQNGGLASVMADSDIVVPGLKYRNDDWGTIQNKSKFFTVAVAQSDVQSLLDEMINNNSSNITVILTAQRNKWDEVWQSAAFFFCFQIFLPIINGIGIILACRAILIRFIKGAPTKSTGGGTKRPEESHNLIQFGLVLSLASVSIRFCCLVISPVFSNSKIIFIAAGYLNLITNSFEMLITMILTVLFMRWGAFGQLTYQKQEKIKIVLLGIGFFSIVIQVIVSYFQVFRLTGNVFIFTQIAVLITFVFLITTTAVFLKYGMRLIKMISSVVGYSTNASQKLKSRYKRKSVTWIMIGAFFQLFQLAAYGVAVDQEFLWSPLGLNLFFGLLFFGLSMNSLTNIQALSPRGGSLILTLKALATKDPIGTKKSYSSSAGAYFAEDAQAITHEKY